jgi:hypothetical protein
VCIPIRNALREIHGYAKRASEEEEARMNKDLDKAKELEDKLTKSIELLTKSSERIEAKGVSEFETAISGRLVSSCP